MARDPLGEVVGFVTEHSYVVVLVLLVGTAGVAAGIPQLDFSRADNGNATEDTTVAQKADYADEQFRNLGVRVTNRSDDRPTPPANGSESRNGPESDAADGTVAENTTTETAAGDTAYTVSHRVFVHRPGGNVLSRESLLASLRFHEQVSEQPAIEGRLDGEGRIAGIATVVGTQAAGDPDATISEQRAAVETLGQDRIYRLIEQAIEREPRLRRLLPADYENGSGTDLRTMVFETTVNTSTTSPAAGSRADPTEQATARAIHRTAENFGAAEYFTLGDAARSGLEAQWNQNTLELLVPVSLLLIVLVLAFAYRDIVDIGIGLVGVLVSLVWSFGIIGWLGVSAGATIIVGPVLIVGLSVDYGLHVFMRYREQRTDEDEGPHEPMTGSLRSVALALVLVTVTTGVGFMANVTSEFPAIRNLALGITLGVVSALVVFTTLVPAMKIIADSALERLGFDRRKSPLGGGRFLRPVLTSGVAIARRAAPFVVALALLAGIAGAATWGSLERQGFQEREDGEVAQWKQDLPEPIGWDVPEYLQHRRLVTDAYRFGPDRDVLSSGILVQGSVTDPGTLEAIAAGQRTLSSRGPVDTEAGQFHSPVTVVADVAARNETVAAVVDREDTDDDGVPDQNLTAVYDAVYGAEENRAETVIERRGGLYRSLLITVPVDSAATYDSQGDAMQGGAVAIEAENGALTATAVGAGAISEAEAIQTANGLFRTMLVALVAVFLVLLVVYRITEGSASLGAVTAVPIVLVVALLLGSMYLLSVPLTPVTALLVSLVVGLGIDYSIHISDRFAEEFDPEEGAVPALERAVVGTGGALLGSTLTSGGAFLALLLHPSPQFRSFGTLVVLSLVVSFVVSVYVLPSLLVLWARHGRTLASEAADSASAITLK